MTLSDYAELASILASGATVLIAFWVFLWTIRSEKNNQRRQSNNEMQTYNLAVLQDDNLLKMEAENHPFGYMELEDARKMYRYFLWMTVADNLSKSIDKKFLDKSLLETRFANQARVSFPDRKFIEDNVFPRGYEQDLIDRFRKHWDAIEVK